jgi:hypothetical protein
MEADGAHNIWLAADKLNTIQILPGQALSVNEALGGISEEAGYVSAADVVDGKDQRVAGGGINQVASTVHAAALPAGLEVSARQKMAWPAGYIPAGLDADILTPGADLVLNNTTGQPVYLVLEMDGQEGVLRATWYGVPFEDGYERKVSSEVTATEPAGGDETVDNGELPAGTSNVLREAHDGCRAVVSMEIIEVDGSVRESTELYTDEYPPYGKLTEQGPAPAATPRPTRAPSTPQPVADAAPPPADAPPAQTDTAPPAESTDQQGAVTPETPVAPPSEQPTVAPETPAPPVEPPADVPVPEAPSEPVVAAPL